MKSSNVCKATISDFPKMFTSVFAKFELTKCKLSAQCISQFWIYDLSKMTFLIHYPEDKTSVSA